MASTTASTLLSTTASTFAPLEQRDYDLLSFLSIFTAMFPRGFKDLPDFPLETVVLDDATYKLPDTSGSGASFTINLVQGNEIASSQEFQNYHRKTTSLPELFALKLGNKNRNADPARNRKITNSMAIEVQILRNSYLHEHQNVVSLLGVCWHAVTSNEDSVMPVLVLEAAELGDLQQFLAKNPRVTSRDHFQLSIDIASGLKAVHDVGIIHCDIKPSNILVFKHENGSFIAKIADFGSSVLVSDAEETLKLPSWTKVWRAPEWDQILQRNDLVKTDIFSFGLVLWYIFTNGTLQNLLDRMSMEGFDGPSWDELKESPMLVQIAEQTLEEKWDQQDGNTGYFESYLDEFDKPFAQATICATLTVTLCHDPKERLDKADAVLSKLSFASQMHSSLREFRNKGMGQTSQPVTMQSLVRADEVVTASKDWGNMRMIPAIVRRHIMKVLKSVAQDKRQPRQRRNKAAYEYVYLSIDFLQIDRNIPGDALQVLADAAVAGHVPSQSIIGQLAEGLQYPLNVSKEVEKSWLEHGTMRGNYAARKRLLQIDPARHKAAVQSLREVYMGDGQLAFEDYLEEDADDWPARHSRIRKNRLALLADDLYYFQSGLRLDILHTASSCGDVSLVELIFDRCIISVDERNNYGETALLVACRSGHAHLVEYFLAKGADPSLASNSGITCLHYLSAFDEDRIGPISKGLHERGALLEAHTTTKVDYNEVNSNYSKNYGTPLLWAVIADSIPACKALMELGADPFDLLGERLSVQGREEPITYWTPVDYAARLHQHYLLEIMFESPKANENLSRLMTSMSLADDTIANNLNNCFRIYDNNREAPISTLPLFWALDYASSGLMRRLLLHGSRHQEACTMTIDLLLRYGADFAKVSTSGNGAFKTASCLGQPFLLEHLLSIEDGKLRPSRRTTFDILINLASIEDRISFATLTRLGIETDNVGYGQGSLISNLIHYSKDPFFVGSILAQESAAHPDFNYTRDFQLAVIHGHLESAKLLFDTGRCKHNAVLRKANKKDQPFLGALIQQAKRYRNIDGKIKFILSLSDKSDEEFFDCGEVGEPKVTLLQLALIYTEFLPALTTSNAVVKAILEKYHEPRHLNHKGLVAAEETTALHLATWYGNVSGLRALLEEHDSLDFNILNSEGESPFDVAYRRWGGPETGLEAWQVPKDQWEWFDAKRDQTTVEIIKMIKKFGARYRKYISVIIRTEEDVVVMIDFRGEMATFNIPFSVFKGVPRGTGQVFDKIRDLRVGHSFHLADVPGNHAWLDRGVAFVKMFAQAAPSQDD